MSRQETEAFIERERGYQRQMDRFYLRRGHKIEDRRGNRVWDVVLRVNGGRRDHVEEKFRDGDFGDFLLEICQDLVSGNLGWVAKTQCDHLHYIVCQEGRPMTLYRVKWREFKEWFFNYAGERKHFAAIVSNKGWGLTVNLVLPWRDVPSTLVEKFNIEREAA